MAIVIFSVHHEDNSYSPMAVVKDNGEVVSPNSRLKSLLEKLGNSDIIESELNNGQSKVTGRFPEERAMEILQQSGISRESASEETNGETKEGIE